MGFLDHSTNNIIVDAVLTEKGREILATNAGAFQIVQFTLADDEVDYRIIERFGRTVGKEKIIKNTPVFEAQTMGEIALKHSLVSQSGQLDTLPVMSLISPTDLSFKKNNTSITLSLQSQMEGVSTAVPTGFQDTSFIIGLPTRFLSFRSTTSAQKLFDTGNLHQTAMYRVAGNATSRGTTLSLSLSVNQGLTTTDFNVYGDPSTNKASITSIVSVVGNQSGLRADLQIIIRDET